VGKLLVHVEGYLMLPAGILLPLFEVLMAANQSIFEYHYNGLLSHSGQSGLIEMYVLCTHCM
jgi:hypothetical protein